jgi:transglutaminase-like putative cysteine protease
MLGAWALAGQPDPCLSPGAAAVYVSDDPMMVRARELIAAGRLTEAAQVLAAGRVSSDGARKQAAEDGLETIRRLRRDYSLDLPGLAERLRKSIPDVTADDVRKWQEAGEAQYRVLDGQVAFFIREPSNIFRFCEEAKRRRAARTATQPGGEPDKESRSRQELIKHLVQVIDAAKSSGRSEVVPLSHHIVYTLTVSADRSGARKGSVVRCWLPFPQEYRQQKQVRLISTSPTEHRVSANVVDGRPLGGSAQRTLYMEQTILDPARPVVFKEEFEYLSFAFYPKLDDSAARSLPADWGTAFLEEKPPHIVFPPALREAVKQAVGNETNPLARARGIFNYVATKMRYCAEEEYAIIPSFTAKALSTLKGDCGIHSMLFISMCRAAGIPARWQSGWETKPEDWNMHDWAEFYVEPWGWLPADTSYGLQKSDDPRVREFYFGHQDAYRMIVNFDYGCPLDPPKPSLRSEPADFQRGEVEIDGRNLYFDEWDWSFKFDAKPLGD